MAVCPHGQGGGCRGDGGEHSRRRGADAQQLVLAACGRRGGGGAAAAAGRQLAGADAGAAGGARPAGGAEHHRVRDQPAAVWGAPPPGVCVPHAVEQLPCGERRRRHHHQERRPRAPAPADGRRLEPLGRRRPPRRRRGQRVQGHVPEQPRHRAGLRHAGLPPVPHTGREAAAGGARGYFAGWSDSQPVPGDGRAAAARVQDRDAASDTGPLPSALEPLLRRVRQPRHRRDILQGRGDSAW
mmetsp:Transcript_4771/g.11592  ORF Transcript_4771/g.11592 Transcript_4771/m.11592 type:complete len:241 (-) Transcript_4771:460-1182(-)